jgi:DNA-dependent RNA polymerase auxiliary subunit epsilon
VELAWARINLRDLRDALALLASQAAEIAALKAEIEAFENPKRDYDDIADENQRLYVERDAQAAEIAELQMARSFIHDREYEVEFAEWLESVSEAERGDTP